MIHSQLLSETTFTQWAIIQEDRNVLVAHCNRKVGLGVACTHIAAMLFSVVATVKVRESQTLTETKSYWLPVSMQKTLPKPSQKRKCLTRSTVTQLKKIKNKLKEDTRSTNLLNHNPRVT